MENISQTNNSTRHETSSQTPLPLVFNRWEGVFEGIPYYRYAGGSARYALILLPGGGAHAGYYDQFCVAHAQQGAGEVWAVDPIGHGRSASRRGRFTMDAYLRDVVVLAAHIREQTGLPVFTLGSSLGSGAAFYAMELSADIVGGIGMGICMGAAGWMRDIRRLLLSPDVDALMAAFGDAMELNIFRHIGLDRNYGSAEQVQRILNDPLVCERYDFASYRSYITYEPPTNPADNAKPFLITIGEKDPMFPREEIDRVHGALGGAVQLSIFPGAPHQLMFWDSLAYSNAIDSWVGQQLQALARSSV